MEILYAPPSKLKVSPYKHIVTVVLETNQSGEAVDVELWVQVSQDITKMEWMEIGEFLTKALHKDLHGQFLEQCFDKYQANQKDSKKE